MHIDSEKITRLRMVRKGEKHDSEAVKNYVVPKLIREEVKFSFLEESEMKILFPKAREKYIKQQETLMRSILKTIFIDLEIDYKMGSMAVKTNSKTFDPYSIILAKNFIAAVARFVPVPEARILIEDESKVMALVKLKSYNLPRERKLRRVQRLIGPNSATLKAIQVLTSTKLFFGKNTIVIIGSHRGLREAENVIHDTMSNIHPVYSVKELMVKRELSKREDLKEVSWKPYLPTYKKRVAKFKTKFTESRRLASGRIRDAQKVDA